MANLLDNSPVVHEREVTPPAVLPARLEPPTSLLLPPTVAGRQRLNPGWVIPSSKDTAQKQRMDWAEIGMIALIPASMALAVYRLFWSIQP